MTGLCECGCGGIPKVANRNDPRSGEVKGQHRRYIKGHQRRGKFGPYGPQKGKIRYEVDEVTGCWNWLLAKDSLGKYGLTSRPTSNGKRLTIQAHIESYESIKGPVPEGLELDHLCRNTGCVNPDHLEAVTRTENIRRRPDLKLDVVKADEIKKKFAAGGVSKAQLAREYGVARSTASGIIRGLYWKDVA